MKKLIACLKYLSDIYQWTTDEKREIWSLAKDCPKWQAYWYRLELAHKAGYKQTEENGYMRLMEWERRISAEWEAVDA